MRDMRKEGYFTGWMFDDETRKKSHRIYYNDIDIATGNLLCDDEIVGNIMDRDLRMTLVDKRNNFMW